MRITPLIFLILTLLCACGRDVSDVVVEGRVLKLFEKEPSQGVKVEVICWKYGNSPDESFASSETKIVTTDSAGNYFASFDAGAFMVVKVAEEGFFPVIEDREVYRKRNTFNIYLKRSPLEKTAR